MMKRTIRIISFVLVLAIISTGVLVSAQKGPVKIGSKNFTEQYIVSNLMNFLLQDRGFDVKLKPYDVTTFVVRKALEKGETDMYMEYTGTGWFTHFGETEVLSAKETEERVRERDLAENNIHWLNCLPINNTYAMTVWKNKPPKGKALYATSEEVVSAIKEGIAKTAEANDMSVEEYKEEYGIREEINQMKTLSDLAFYTFAKEGKVKVGIDHEFYARPDGLFAMTLHYTNKLDIPEPYAAFHPEYIKVLAVGLTMGALVEEEVDLTMVFGTDPHAAHYGWVVLEDDKSFFPPYDLCPSVRGEVLDEYPEIESILNELVASFPTERGAARSAMAELNGIVDIEKKDPEYAACKWLLDHDLLQSDEMIGKCEKELEK